MVTIESLARTFARSYGVACLLGANTSVPVPEAAATIATYFLPNATQFSLGKVTRFPDSTTLAAAVEEDIAEKATVGYGSNFTLDRLRVERVSNESAAVWITWLNHPLDPERFDEFRALDLYGFRLDPEASNGLGGGWEFVIPDNAVFGFRRVTGQ